MFLEMNYYFYYYYYYYYYYYSSAGLRPYLSHPDQPNRISLANTLQRQISSFTLSEIHRKSAQNPRVWLGSQNLIRLVCSQPNPPERPGNHLTTTTSADSITILLTADLITVKQNAYLKSQFPRCAFPVMILPFITAAKSLRNVHCAPRALYN